MKLIEKIYQNKVRKELRNKDFSILCSNCIGGIIYHRLGLKFLSPTINLWMWQNDYLKFVNNLEKYLSLELNFINTEYNFPVAKLDDITIYFNHYKSIEDAEYHWNIRKTRVNYDNLFLIMYDKDGLTKQDLLKLKEINCKGKIVISNNSYSDLDYVIKIPANMKNPETRYRLNKGKITGLRKFEKYLNIVKWLNYGN